MPTNVNKYTCSACNTPFHVKNAEDSEPSAIQYCQVCGSDRVSLEEFDTSEDVSRDFTCFNCFNSFATDWPASYCPTCGNSVS